MAYLVNIDAGHGSDTAGKRTAPFTKNVDIDGDGVIDVKKGEQYREHYANVAIAVELEKELKRCGIKVAKTGWNDANGKNDKDTALADRQKAVKAAKCDISVSIHFNASGDGKTFNSGEGVSVHIHSNSARVGDSKKLADKVLAELVKGTTQKNRGVVKQELAMCNCTTMGTKAAILLELAFMTNAREAMELMANAKFQKECAQEIAKGICSYAGIKYVANTALSSKYTEPTRTIYYQSGKPIMTGDDVRWVQDLLEQNGHKITVDGQFGPASNTALCAFQGKRGLTVDGKCGAATRTQLKIKK